MTDPLPRAPDQDLVARIRAGDESAFQEVFLQHYKRLCVIAARMTGRRAQRRPLPVPEGQHHPGARGRPDEALARILRCARCALALAVPEAWRYPAPDARRIARPTSVEA